MCVENTPGGGLHLSPPPQLVSILTKLGRNGRGFEPRLREEFGHRVGAGGASGATGYRIFWKAVAGFALCVRAREGERRRNGEEETGGPVGRSDDAGNVAGERWDGFG